MLGVPAARAAAIAAEYPPAAYPSPAVGFSALVGDANFACPALRIDQRTSQRVPVFAYEFNDDSAPLRFTPPLVGPPVATHGSELQYLFDLTATFPSALTAPQEQLAASMRQYWTNFASRGFPSSSGEPLWPRFDSVSQRMISLIPPQPQAETGFAAEHHCAFWALAG